MKVTAKNGNIYITEVKDFDLEQTVECGQCFHFKKISEGEYGISAYGRLLHIRQEEKGKLILYSCALKEYEEIWENYFDLGRDYGVIKEWLVYNNPQLGDAVEAMWGIRILNQEFFETLISFIISQNKQIGHIKQIVENLSKKYGQFLGKIGEEEFYSFPDINTLKGVTVEEYRELKAGFRAPYIYDAVQKILEGVVNERDFAPMDSSKAMAELMKIKGVGEKVANCVMLFSLGKRDAFPVDVWIKRIMEALYFHEETRPEVIRKKASGMFGEYGGYAQQYLFYYGKIHNIGK